VEEWGLVDLVDEAHRHEQQTGAKIERLPCKKIEGEELDLDLALLVTGDDRVLELDLGVEDDPVGELVTGIEDETLQIKLIGLALSIADELLEAELAVTADRETAFDLIDLRCRRAETVDALELLVLRQYEDALETFDLAR